jgi:hypothetical protein
MDFAMLILLKNQLMKNWSKKDTFFLIFLVDFLSKFNPKIDQNNELNFIKNAKKMLKVPVWYF